MKILLFGGAGQLGYEVQTRARDLNFTIVAPVISEVDISNAPQVSFLVSRVEPDVIINAAAYTAVDLAETHRDEAFASNQLGARNVALAARDSHSRVIHISTDYVFGGEQTIPYTEEDIPYPCNVYGESKRAGEEEILSILGSQGLIVRTSSLFGNRGVNFVDTMLRLFAEKTEVGVVNDQIMCPTWAGWLGEVLLDVCRLKIDGGIVHASCSGEVSWFGFAEEILLQATELGLIRRDIHIRPISSAEFKRPAIRPPYSAMSCRKLATIVGREPMRWEEGLHRFLLERTVDNQ